MHERAVSAAGKTFWSYTRAFQSLNAKAVASHFHEPAMLITPRGVQALPNRSAVERAYAEIMAELKGTRYTRTEFSSVTEQRLSEDVVTLDGSGTWVDGAGKPYMPFGFTYTLRRAPDGWQIVVALIHAPHAR